MHLRYKYENEKIKDCTQNKCYEDKLLVGHGIKISGFVRFTSNWCEFISNFIELTSWESQIILLLFHKVVAIDFEVSLPQSQSATKLSSQLKDFLFQYGLRTSNF